ncbi:MAG: hypothetical protein CL917_17010 [Deltaproteobacteria bacterium]|nr:hypothetical protein [Deltaproteobacteria bacterium]
MTNDAHSQPSGQDQELLYDPAVAQLSHGERARTLLETVNTATLCTLSHKPADYPYGSFVTFSMDGHLPTFFISELAEHTQNLRRDTRASLMVAESGGEDPLANSRVTLVGRVELVVDQKLRESAKESYLASHPSAAHYIDYSDFSFWQLHVESLRYIGGYGRMSWVDGEQWRLSEADPTISFSEGVLTHMNEDHGEAMVDYCKAFSKAIDTTSATMTQIDRYGFEMSASTQKGPRPIRLAFPEPILTSEDARKQMVALVKKARQLLDAQSPE